MINQKGAFLALLGLLLVVLSIQSVIAVEEASQYAEMYISFDDDYACDDDNNVIDEVRPTYTSCEPPELGCSLESNEDSSSCGGIVPGLIITQYHQENLFCGNGNSGTYKNPLFPGTDQKCNGFGGKYKYYYCPHTISGKLAANLADDNIKTQDGFQYVCSDNHYWSQCSAENENKVAWANNIMYKCVIENNEPAWKPQPGEDIDHDSYTTADGDCDDNPQDDPSLCSEIESIDDCSNLKYSPCAICIHPNAPETCGDGADNDCSDTTSDDCNKFREGCEQTALPASEDPDSEQYLGEQKNKFGEPFSWTSTEDGGYCCGYKGPEDLGETETAPDGEQLCLNKNFASYAGEGDPPGWKSDCDEWCWLPAAKFSRYSY